MPTARRQAPPSLAEVAGSPVRLAEALAHCFGADFAVALLKDAIRHLECGSSAICTAIGAPPRPEDASGLDVAGDASRESVTQAWVSLRSVPPLAHCHGQRMSHR